MKKMYAWVVALGIAGPCLGYFLSYVPYSMMTKMATSGLYSGMDGKGFTGFAIQPIMVGAGFITAFACITMLGWWKYATQFRLGKLSLPRPQWFTLVSGICLSGQIITTNLAYTFQGVSIVFAMLLMRGGVLAMAPIVDIAARKRKRKIYWPSLVASALSIGALIVSFSGGSSTTMSIVCAVDIGIYIFVYFFRLLFMSNRAKSHDDAETKRYYVEEQMVASPVLFSSLLVMGLFGANMDPSTMMGQVWSGFVTIPYQGYFWMIFLTGVLMFGTGIFGTFIFLDKRENTFTVPASRCSSVIAGVVASYLLATYYGQKLLPASELIGVALIVGAIVFLAYRSVIEKRAAKRAAAAATGQQLATETA